MLQRHIMSGKNFLTSYYSLKKEWAILQSRKVFLYLKLFRNGWISEMSVNPCLPGQLGEWPPKSELIVWIIPDFFCSIHLSMLLLVPYISNLGISFAFKICLGTRLGNLNRLWCFGQVRVTFILQWQCRGKHTRIELKRLAF